MGAQADAETDVSRRLAPALRHLAAMRTDLSSGSLAAVRTLLNQRRGEAAAVLPLDGVAVTDATVPSSDGHAIPIRTYRGGGPLAPAVLYCHSGAFVLGNLDTDHRQCVELAIRGQCTIVSVDYRLAPEHPDPAGFDDVLTVLDWIASNGDAVDVDVNRLAVAGSSAGGAFAARLAQHAAEGSAPPVVFQLLHQPVLDDAPTPAKEEFRATPGLDGPAAQQMWRHLSGGAAVPTGAVPARADDLGGLATALITCSELDPLRDEAIDYAFRLLWAGVATELHVFPGTCHGFDSLLPDWEGSQQLFALQGAALRRALHAAD
jgi:acetyl esterase/lipase